METVLAWAAAWESCAPAQILGLWDKSDKQSWYLPADSVGAHVGGAVVGMIQRRCLGLRGMSYRPQQIVPRRLSVDVGAAFFVFDWTRTSDAQPNTMGGRLRATVVMRKTPEGWRVFHYAEAPLAPLLELQGFYERVAAAGLEAIPQRIIPS
jgi:hypothetical protein